MTLKGWITGHKDDEQFLRGLGVTIKSTDTLEKIIPGVVEWTVELDEKAMEKLDPHWGRFIWTIDEVQEDRQSSKGN